MFVLNAVQARFQYQMAEILFLEWHPHSFHVCAYSWMPVCLICFPGLYSILVLAGSAACRPTLFTSWCRGWFRSAWCGTACWGWSCCEKSTSCHCGKRCPGSRSCWPSGCWAAGSRSDLRTSAARQSTSGGRTRPWCIPAQKFRVEGFISATTVPADAASAHTTVCSTPGESDRWAYVVGPAGVLVLWGFFFYYFFFFFPISGSVWYFCQYTKYNIQEKEIGMENAHFTRNLNTCILISVAGGTLRDIAIIVSKQGRGSNPETHLSGVLLWKGGQLLFFGSWVTS